MVMIALSNVKLHNIAGALLLMPKPLENAAEENGNGCASSRLRAIATTASEREKKTDNNNNINKHIATWFIEVE